MPSTIGKCILFRIKHITLLEGETFLRNKHEIAFFEIKCTFFGRKENIISVLYAAATFSTTTTFQTFSFFILAFSYKAITLYDLYLCQH